MSSNSDIKKDTYETFIDDHRENTNDCPGRMSEHANAHAAGSGTRVGTCFYRIDAPAHRLARLREGE